MSYTVTHDIGGPVGLDFGPQPKGYDLDGALAAARELLLEGKANVTIQDGNGNSISGNELVACCNGDKKLTADLRAISN
jgi:hypothetical protein